MLKRSKWTLMLWLVVGVLAIPACTETAFVDEEPEDDFVVEIEVEEEDSNNEGGEEDQSANNSATSADETTIDDSGAGDNSADDSNDEEMDEEEADSDAEIGEDEGGDMSDDYQKVAYAQWTDDARLYPFDWFNHFRTATWTVAGQPEKGFAVRLENSVPLSLTHYIVEASGIADNEIYDNMAGGVFENSSYFYSPEFGCIWSNEGAGNQMMRDFNTDSFLSLPMGEKVDAVYEGMETLHGLDTYVFTIGEETLSAELDTDMPEIVVFEATARVNLYPISDEVSLIIQAEFLLVSNYDSFDEQFVERVTNLYNVGVNNIGVEFEPRIPEPCLAQREAIETTYPIYPGASPLGGVQEITVLIVSDVTAEEVAAWYERTYLEDEWTLATKNELVPGAIMIDFSKNGESISITITTDPQTGAINITFIDF